MTSIIQCRSAASFQHGIDIIIRNGISLRYCIHVVIVVLTGSDDLANLAIFTLRARLIWLLTLVADLTRLLAN